MKSHESLLGENEMKYLAKICLIMTACLATADVASAIDPLKPFISVTVPKGVVNLGQVYGPGWKHLEAQVVANVVANCPYHLEASFQGLTHAQGKAVISPKHMQVEINGKGVPVGDGHVSVAGSSKPTPSSGHDVPIDLRVGVTGLTFYPAGQYNGVLVIRAMIGP